MHRSISRRDRHKLNNKFHWKIYERNADDANDDVDNNGNIN